MPLRRKSTVVSHPPSNLVYLIGWRNNPNHWSKTSLQYRDHLFFYVIYIYTCSIYIYVEPLAIEKLWKSWIAKPTSCISALHLTPVAPPYSFLPGSSPWRISEQSCAVRTSGDRGARAWLCQHEEWPLFIYIYINIDRWTIAKPALGVYSWGPTYMNI